MCDSDDEYLSAEEGVGLSSQSNSNDISDSNDVVVFAEMKPVVISKEDHAVLYYPHSTKCQGIFHSCNVEKSSVDSEIKPPSVGEKTDSSSSTEDVNADSSTGSDISDAQSSSHSLSFENKQILAEVLDQVSHEMIDQHMLPAVHENNDGWDDSPETPEYEVVKETVGEKECVSAQTVEAEEIVEEENNDWGDWGDDPEWSLVKEGFPKTENKEFINSNEEVGTPQKSPLSSTEKQEDVTWGWGNLASAVGDSFVNAVGMTLGLPDAEDFAKRKANEEKLQKLPLEMECEETVPKSASISSGFRGFGLFSGIVTGGIDVLESIGKKTFETITVKDPGMGRRRLIFEANDKENLSDLLKQMKLNEESEKASTSMAIPLTRDFASVFGRSDGMSYLEALEMVSNQKPKMDLPISRAYIEQLNGVNIETEIQNFEAALCTAIRQISRNYSSDHLLKARSAANCALQSTFEQSEIVDTAVEHLVNYTAAAVQMVDKLACLHLISSSPCEPFKYIPLYTLLVSDLYSLAGKFTAQALNEEDQTTILIEAQTGIEFIKQAYRLLVPIIFS